MKELVLCLKTLANTQWGAVDGLIVQELYHANFREEGQAAGVQRDLERRPQLCGHHLVWRQGWGKRVQHHPKPTGRAEDWWECSTSLPKVAASGHASLSRLTRHTLKSVVVSYVPPQVLCLLRKQ